MDRPSVITHTRDVIDNTHTLRRRKAKPFSLPDGVVVSRVIFNSNYIDYIIGNDDESNLNIESFLLSVHDKISSILRYELDVKNGLKANMQLLIRFVNIIGVYLDFAYKTSSSSLSNEDDVSEFVQNMCQNLLADVENRQLQDSGWSLFAIKRIDLKVSKHVYLPGRGSMRIPKWITSKRATLPINNIDHFCFKWSIIAAFLHKQKIKINQRNLFEHDHLFNFDINFPPNKKDIRRFCSLNNSSVHVFGVIDRNFYPIYICKKIQKRHFNLLYYENGNKAHFCPIVHLSRLIGSQVSKNTRTKYFCLKCLLHFPNQMRLDVHITACGNEQLGTIILPKEKHFYEFDRQDACQKNYILLTIDCESFLRPVHTSAPPPEQSYTLDIQEHELASIAIYCKVLLNTPECKKIPSGKHFFIYKEGESLGDKLISYFDLLTRSVHAFYNKHYPIHVSKEQEKKYLESTECFACHKPFTESDIRVMDHEHSIPTHNFRGAVHATCNLRIKRKKVIPIYAHGMLNYDSHIFIKLFAERRFQINVIPHTIEKYLCFEVRMNGIILKFLDSNRIFNAKLETVLDSLPNEYFIETKKVFPAETHEFIFSKLSFPYKFLSGPESLNYNHIPPKEFFDNDLSGESISNIDYERAKLCWTKLNCKTFADYVEHYNCADAVQLLDSILHFREIIYNSFGLELTSFYSLPHLSITAMLKLAKVRIQVFDQSMQAAYEMIKRSIFGGVVSCNVRYMEAKDDLHIELADINAAYVWGMRENLLPISCYTFVPVNSENWETVNTQGEFGYFMEVDLSFPDSIHDALNSFVPIVEKKVPPGAKTERLVSDFSDKVHHVITVQHFQLLIRLGVVCTHIWQVLRYRQANYMAAYIDIVAKWRRESRSKFEISLYKGMSCYIFGKLIEGIEKRKKIVICTDERRLQKLVRKGQFKDRYIYNYPTFSMAVVELSKGVVLQNRPIIVGSFILSITKVFLFNFWYSVMLPNFESCLLHATDTDSILYSFKSNNPNSIYKRLAEHYDFSNLSPDHELYCTKNKGVLGKFKLESGGKKILAACCVKSKCYSLLFENSCVNKLKGVQKDYVLKKLTFDDYVRCVKYNEMRFALYKTIISREHNLYTVQQCKLGLESTDYKRHILPGRIFTLAHSHYLLRP